jgi:hypothetical protein
MAEATPVETTAEAAAEPTDVDLSARDNTTLAAATAPVYIPTVGCMVYAGNHGPAIGSVVTSYQLNGMWYATVVLQALAAQDAMAAPLAPTRPFRVGDRVIDYRFPTIPGYVRFIAPADTFEVLWDAPGVNKWIGRGPHSVHRMWLRHFEKPEPASKA